MQAFGTAIRALYTVSSFHSSPSRSSGAKINRPELTHISSTTGKPEMVSVSSKTSSLRSASAVGRVLIPEDLFKLLVDNDGRTSKKGNVMTIAQLAGIMGAKKTSDLIPLCHPINLSNIQVDLRLCRQTGQGDPDEFSERITDGEITEHTHGTDSDVKFWVQTSATAECIGPTGVEMEALTAVSVACLTVWDMLKAAAGDRMQIEGIKVIKKSGGRSGDWQRSHL